MMHPLLCSSLSAAFLGWFCMATILLLFLWGICPRSRHIPAPPWHWTIREICTPVLASVGRFTSSDAELCPSSQAPADLTQTLIRLMIAGLEKATTVEKAPGPGAHHLFPPTAGASDFIDSTRHSAAISVIHRHGRGEERISFKGKMGRLAWVVSPGLTGQGLSRRGYGPDLGRGAVAHDRVQPTHDPVWPMAEGRRHRTGRSEALASSRMSGASQPSSRRQGPRRVLTPDFRVALTFLGLGIFMNYVARNSLVGFVASSLGIFLVVQTSRLRFRFSSDRWPAP